VRTPSLCALLWLAACASPEPAPRLGGDYARLEGTWVVTYNEAYGWPLPERNGALFVINGDRIKRSTDAGDQRFSLDESATPKRIDFYDEQQAAILGIYRLDGDELVICTNGGAGEVRPSRFRTALFSVSNTILTRFKRSHLP